MLGHIPDDKKQVTEEESEWMNIHTLLDTLGPEGMSSDDSNVNDAGNRTFHVKIMEWQNLDMVWKMVEIDKDWNTTNAYGNTRAGNAPRLRKRWEDGRKTSRKAPPHLPINFYNAQWYASLKPGQKKELAAGPEVVIL